MRSQGHRWAGAGVGLWAFVWICLAMPGAPARAQEQAPIQVQAPIQPQTFPEGFVERTLHDPETGLPIHVVTKARPGAPWVVLIHGLGQQAARDWLPVLPALAEHHQLLVFDLPGFGRSGLPDATLTPPRFAEFVHRQVRRHTQGPVMVVGHSLGGAIALRYTHDHPADVDRLLLIDAAGILQTSVFTRHLSRVPERIDVQPTLDKWVARGSRLLNHFSGKAQDLTAAYTGPLPSLAGSDLARELLYKDAAGINAALGLVNEDFTPVVRAIKTPVWILWGEDDPVAPVRTGIALQWLLPQSRLSVLPGIGHVPMREAPSQTVAWLLDALQAKPSLSSAREREMGASQGDGSCKDQKDKVFTGRWQSLHLAHCANVRIENAQLGRLVIERSSVSLVNVDIQSLGTALEARRAQITATGLRISAPQAWSVQDSRLDLAAVDILAMQLGRQQDGSQFFLSLGRWCDGAGDWRLHAVWKPEDGVLDPQFRQTRDGGCALAVREVAPRTQPLAAP